MKRPYSHATVLLLGVVALSWLVCSIAAISLTTRSREVGRSPSIALSLTRVAAGDNLRVMQIHGLYLPCTYPDERKHRLVLISTRTKYSCLIFLPHPDEIQQLATDWCVFFEIENEPVVLPPFQYHPALYKWRYILQCTGIAHVYVREFVEVANTRFVTPEQICDHFMACNVTQRKPMTKPPSPSSSRPQPQPVFSPPITSEKEIFTRFRCERLQLIWDTFFR